MAAAGGRATCVGTKTVGEALTCGAPPANPFVGMPRERASASAWSAWNGGSGTYPLPSQSPL